MIVTHLYDVGRCVPPSDLSPRGGMQWGKATLGHPVADDEAENSYATPGVNELTIRHSDSTDVMTYWSTTGVDGGTSEEMSTALPGFSETSSPTRPVLGGDCVEVNDCTQVEDSTCKNSTCQCKDEFHQLEDTCLKSKLWYNSLYW